MERTYFLLVILLSGFLTYMNVSTEFCSMSEKDENILHFLSMVSFFIIMGPALLYVLGKDKHEQKKYVPKVFGVFFLCCAPVFFSTMHRANVMKEEFWEFSGVVNDKYISSNHAMKSIKVGDESFEGLPSAIWDQIEIGSPVKKKSCQGTIEINGQEYKYSG